MSHHQMGHSSLNITDTWVDGAHTNGKNYVSWWPGGDDAGKFKTKSWGVEANGFLHDIQDESGYAPDHVIRIGTGLDTQAMLSKWAEIRAKNSAHYHFYRKNCSTVVARVLREGTKSGSGWYRHSTIWTPLKVKRFAFDIGGYELEWSSFVEEISQYVTGPEVACLRMLKRRSSSHGFSGAAKPRFIGGRDTGKFNPYAPWIERDSNGQLKKVHKEGVLPTIVPI